MERTGLWIALKRDEERTGELPGTGLRFREGEASAQDALAAVEAWAIQM
jgi:hypothetical protein